MKYTIRENGKTITEKIPGAVQEFKGSWYILFTSAEGKRVKRVAPGVGKEGAVKALRAANEAVAKGEEPRALRVNASNPAPVAEEGTFAHLCTRFIQLADDLEPTTRRMYELTINKHLIPKFGKQAIESITTLNLVEFYSELRNRDAKPLSPKTVKNIHSILLALFKNAIAWKLCPSNPATGAKIPKQKKPTVQHTDADGLKKVIQAADGAGIYRLPFLIAVYTGMRRGEIAGLQWGDYDKGNQTLKVSRAVAIVSGQGHVVKGTKTDRHRTVDIPPVLCDVLDAHRAEVTTRQGEEPRADEFVCTRDGVNHLSLKELSEKFTELSKASELGITLHGLRHSMVTMLLENGVPDHVVAARTGHSIHTMETTYAHASESSLRVASDTVTRLLGED